jgi:hypothetical protein
MQPKPKTRIVIKNKKAGTFEGSEMRNGKKVEFASSAAPSPKSLEKREVTYDKKSGTFQGSEYRDGKKVEFASSAAPSPKSLEKKQSQLPIDRPTKADKEREKGMMESLEKEDFYGEKKSKLKMNPLLAAKLRAKK